MQEFWNAIGFGDIFPIYLADKDVLILALVMAVVILSLLLAKSDKKRR